MTYINYDGNDWWANHIKDYLEDKLDYVIGVFPKITKHLEGNDIIIKESFETKNILAYYNRLDRNIYIISGNIDSKLEAVHALFHEIGHSVQDKRNSLDTRYSSQTKNVAYWREEIKAESYALQIFTRFLEIGSIIDYLKDSIKYLYKGLKDAKKRNTTTYYSTGNLVTGGWIHVWNGSYNSSVTTTWANVSWTTVSNSTTSWNFSIAYAC